MKGDSKLSTRATKLLRVYENVYQKWLKDPLGTPRQPLYEAAQDLALQLHIENA